MYTDETIAIAKSLTMAKDRQQRINALREALSVIEKPITYSNEDFDRAQTLAMLLSAFTL